MFVKDGAGYNRSKFLEKVIEETRDNLLNQIDPEDRHNFKVGLDVPLLNKKFKHIPAVAAVSMLSGLETHALTAENVVIDYLYEKASRKNKHRK